MTYMSFLQWATDTLRLANIFAASIVFITWVLGPRVTDIRVGAYRLAWAMISLGLICLLTPTILDPSSYIMDWRHGAALAGLIFFHAALVLRDIGSSQNVKGSLLGAGILLPVSMVAASLGVFWDVH